MFDYKNLLNFTYLIIRCHNCHHTCKGGVTLPRNVIINEETGIKIEDTKTSKFFSAESNDIGAVVETDSDTGSIWIKNVLEDGSFTLTIPTDSQLPSQFALTTPENNKLIIDSIGGKWLMIIILFLKGSVTMN